MGISLLPQPDAAAFLSKAESWLMRSEAEYNLMIGLAMALSDSQPETRPFLAVVEQAGEVVGCALRTPPHKLVLTRMPEAAIEPLAQLVSKIFDELPAVLGPITEAKLFAGAWAAAKQLKVKSGSYRRIYQLESVLLPQSWPPGQLRYAERKDLDLAQRWFKAFVEESGAFAINCRAEAERLLANDSLVFWEDGEAVSMAAASGRTPNGARIAWVYTPPEFRGFGYASACVSKLSQNLLDSGLRFCFLYTDLANPTSNNIYQKIGYRPVCDVMDYAFS